MTDFNSIRPGLESPPSRAFAVSPDDSSDLPMPIRGLMVAAAGDVTLTTIGGDVITLPVLQPGVQYAILASRIQATGTTAAGIIGLA